MNSDQPTKESWKWYVLAGALLTGGPVWHYLYVNGYPLARAEFLVLPLLGALAGEAIYFSMAEEDIELAMKQPWVSVGIDAGARDTILTSHPHPRAFGAFPRILCHYVRERGVITLPDAVRKFTSLAAARVGLADRGVLKVGMHADLTIFDEARVCDRATFEDPVQTAVGIQHVLVNGVPVVRDARVTGARPGRGLRRSAAAALPPNP